MWNAKLKLFDKLVDQCPNFKRKGKSTIYTSANGYMFALLNKEAEIGIRFSKEMQEKYIKKYETTLYKSNGAVMKGYILITDKMLENTNLIISLLNQSYDYVMSLKTK